MSQSFTVGAPAKLNLNLHITGKRADGFHLLESLVAFTQFGDEVFVAPADVISLTVEGEFANALTSPQDNLVMKAAQLLQIKTGVQQGVHITLHKYLPVGSGMGGGSADAAATLHALMRLWDIAPDKKMLHTLALQLGSDVPMCLTGQPAWVKGIGDDITPVNLRADVHVVLAHPRKSLLTANVYRNFSAPSSAPVKTPETFSSLNELVDYISPLHNALETPAVGIMPEIANILTVLRATNHCALARMSGSGAGCFAFYTDSKSAAAAAASLHQTHPTWWCVATKLEKSHEAQ